MPFTGGEDANGLGTLIQRYFLEGRLNEVASPSASATDAFACGIVVPVVHCSDPRLATNRRFLGSLEVSCFQAATIQIP